MSSDATSSRIERAANHARRCAEGLPLQEALAEFHQLVTDFGFSCSASGAWHRKGHDRLSRFYFNTWPESWVEIYMANALHTDDPIVEEAARSMVPFRFTELRQTWQTNPRHQKVIEIAEAFGWREIFAVPIHGPHSYQGLVSLAAFDIPVLSALDCMALETAARANHQRCRKELGFGQGLEPRPALTERQIECMRWVAAGKSDADIATIIGLSESTVHYHIEQAKKRLGLRSRIEAVAQLILDGTL